MNSQLKEKLLKECIRKQLLLIQDFNNRLNDLKETERNFNDEELDGGQLAQKVQADTEVLILNSQLEFAEKELNILNSLINQVKNCSQVEKGSLVVTDKARFLVCVSIEQFNVDGIDYIGLSTESPIFNSMKGLKKGDAFSFKNQTYLIQEVV